MRKGFIFVVILLLVAVWGWNRYGYLLTSYKNQPPKSQVDTKPTPLVPSQSDPKLDFVNLPPGFSISYFASNIPGARSLTLGSHGTVYVGTRNQNVVYALEDQDQNGVAENRYVIASGLNTPNGVAYHNGDLYVAELGRIIKFKDIDNNYQSNPKYEVVTTDLPSDTHHGWKYLSVGPDQKLYVAIGMPCNTCEKPEIYGTIVRFNLDGSGKTIIARGIRNSVGFDWNPKDNSLWFTDNGRDNLGDDLPGDELNRLSSEGAHFGFPYCHAGTTADPQFGKGKDCNAYIAPATVLGPHVAALGIEFYQGDMFPAEYQNKLLIAEHGSWNRKTPIGYRVTAVDINGSTSSNYRPLFDGWLGSGEKVSGRPVDLLELQDGSLLISDDYAGALYRITYQ
jgi:glucose/arabinose dehydrogenase